MGRHWERHYRSGQAYVYDHDGDDGLHKVGVYIPVCDSVTTLFFNDTSNFVIVYGNLKGL